MTIANKAIVAGGALDNKFSSASSLQGRANQGVMLLTKFSGQRACNFSSMLSEPSLAWGVHGVGPTDTPPPRGLQTGGPLLRYPAPPAAALSSPGIGTCDPSR